MSVSSINSSLLAIIRSPIAPIGKVNPAPAKDIPATTEPVSNQDPVTLSPEAAQFLINSPAKNAPAATTEPVVRDKIDETYSVKPFPGGTAADIAPSLNPASPNEQEDNTLVKTVLAGDLTRIKYSAYEKLSSILSPQLDDKKIPFHMQAPEVIEDPYTPVDLSA